MRGRVFIKKTRAHARVGLDILLDSLSGEEMQECRNYARKTIIP
jgi:anthranilate/para-aminobenzoate synthase component I